MKTIQTIVSEFVRIMRHPRLRRLAIRHNFPAIVGIGIVAALFITNL